MSDRSFRRDSRALKHELETLQDRLEDLGESGGDTAKDVLHEAKEAIEGKLRSLFSGTQDVADEVQDRGRHAARDAERKGKKWLGRAEKRGKKAYRDAERSANRAQSRVDSEDRHLTSSLAIFGLGVAVGWLIARR